MLFRRVLYLASLSLSCVAALAQTACREDTATLSGEVLDITGAAILDATVTLSPGHTVAHTDRTGRFLTECLHDGAYTATIESPSFDAATRTIKLDAESHPFTIRLKPHTVQTEVDAVVPETGVSSEEIAGSRTLEKSDIAQLADDPDEFSRQLQVLAASAGGAPGAAIVTVDGFQNGGRIPPKSSIAFIRINPDLFAAEYARPPYRGGRVEIYTKPGQSSLHGALFTTQSAEFMNAKDPFSPSRAAIGKQRYGFELNGPIRKDRSDFSISLEHRQIDQFAVVDAVTLNSGLETPITANIATPQSLWEASARFSQQLGPKNNLIVSYDGAVNGLTNQGTGGTVLAEAGYNSTQSEHTVRLTDLDTISATLVHETRLGYTWRNRTDTPNSTAPSLQVAGSFTGGGVTTGLLRSREGDLELDDDILYSRGKHTLKAGIELLDTNLNDSLPSGFNGTYIFGGGSAPELDANNQPVLVNGTPVLETISGIEQYRRAQLNLAGGTPTQFDISTGTPNVSLNQLQVVLYAQDQWKYKSRLQFSLGVRWAMQNTPVTIGNAAPRVGISWAPDRKQKTVFHARSGLFFGVVDPQTVLTDRQLNGTTQSQLQIDNPTYGNPFTTGTATLTTLRAPLPSLSQTPSLQSHLGVEHDFPRHWHAQANLYLVHAWDSLRTRNVNAPLNGLANGPRPIEPNVNLLQFQQTGKLGGNVLFLGLDQHSLKHLQIFAGYVRMDLRGNADSDTTAPQSTYSDAGEIARPSWLATHQIIAFSNYVFPYAINLSTQFNAASGNPYNVTTGFDNNNDGNFNDRPFLSTATNPAAYNTRFGALAPTGTGPTIGRNAGTLPWNVHLDANLSRSFALPHAQGREAQTLAVNLRSTNLINHTNVTSVGNVLGSPLFGQAYQADNGRRIEAGLRWSF